LPGTPTDLHGLHATAASPAEGAAAKPLTKAERIAVEREMLNRQREESKEEAAAGSTTAAEVGSRRGERKGRKAAKEAASSDYSLSSMQSGLASVWSSLPSAAEASYWWGGEEKEEKPQAPLQPASHHMQADLDPALPVVTVQLLTVDGRRVNIQVNTTHRVAQLKAMAHSLAPVSGGMRVLLYDWRDTQLADPMMTVEAARLAGTAIRCDVDVGPAGVMLSL